MMFDHFWDAAEFFNKHSIDHDFTEPFYVTDNQGNQHYITSVRQLMTVAWKTTRIRETFE